MSPLRSAIRELSPDVVSTLVDACHRPERQGNLATSVARVLGDGRISELVDFASEHGVLGLVLSSLEPALRDSSRQLAAELDRRLHELRLRSSILELKCRHVVSTLESRHVSPVVLKGAAIALIHFARPWHRDLADLDLLVRPQDVEPALEALEERGYRNPVSAERAAHLRAHHFHLPMVHRDGHYVEIHWALTRPDSAFRLDADRVYWSATRVPIGTDAVMRVPRIEHTVLHIVIQNLQEGFSRICRTVDIDRIVATPDFDWSFLVEEAKRGHLSSATALSLQLGARLLDTDVPLSVRQSLLPPPIARFHLALLRPERHLLSRRATRVRAAEDLLEAWLLDPSRRVSHMAGSMARRYGAWSGAVRLSKLSALQLLFYLSLPFRGRDPDLRGFWTPATDSR